MKKLDIYLDTSIWNYVYADDTPEKKEQTLKFFKKAEKGEYNIYIGSTVIEEIERTKNGDKLKLLSDAIKKYNPIILKVTDEVHGLAEKYIMGGIIPAKKKDDAYHIAFAVYNKMDVLLSWNYQHLANLETKHRITSVDIEEGYFKELELITPYGLLLDEN